MAEKEQRSDDPAATDVTVHGAARAKPGRRRRRRGRRRWRWPSVLRVTGWGDLAALVTVLAFAGAAGAWLWSTFLADDPWQDRADRICLSRGGEWLDVTGGPGQRLRQRIEISHTALDDLQALRSDVPISDTLSYGTMLSDKREFIGLLERKLALIEAGKPTTRVDDQLRSADEAYSVDAHTLGLHVCGQSTGMQ